MRIYIFKINIPTEKESIKKIPETENTKNTNVEVGDYFFIHQLQHLCFQVFWISQQTIQNATNTNATNKMQQTKKEYSNNQLQCPKKTSIKIFINIGTALLKNSP